MKRGVILVLIAMSVLMSLAGCGKLSKEQRTVPKATVSEQEFAFNLADTKGLEHDLSAYQGEKLVVKFWASWCPICLANLDEVEEITSDETKEYQLVTIASPDYKNEQSSADFTKWFKTLELDQMTVLLDEGGELSSRLGIRAYPTYVYYDATGEVAKVVPGHADRETIEATLAEI